MSVLDRNVVDFGHEDDDKVTVCISDHIPCDSEILIAHLEVLQDKVNENLDYITTEQIYEDLGASGKTPNIKDIICHKPTEEVEFILNKIKETIMRGIRISKRLSIPMKNGLY